MNRSRILAVVAVALTILALEIGALGAVQARSEAAGAGMPSQLTVPMPRVGDQVRYTYDLVPSAGADTSRRANLVRPDGTLESDANYMPNAPATPRPYQDFRILGPRTAMHADGQATAAYGVHALQYGLDLQDVTVAGFDAIIDVDAAMRYPVTETMSRVTTESHDGHDYVVNSTETYEVPPPPPDPSRSCSGCGADGAAAAMGFRHPLVRSCLALNHAQGRTLDTDADVQLLPGCHDLEMGVFFDPSRGLDGGFGSTGIPGFDAEFHADRMETVQGIQAIAYQAVWNGEEIEVWLSPQVPYPVRIVVDAHWGSQYPGNNYVLSIRLDSYVAGAAPLPDSDDDASFPPAAPPLVMGPRQPWGLPEDGTDAAFPASAAWNYLQGHELKAKGLPAVAAHFAQDQDVTNGNNITSRRWDFVLFDGSAYRQAFAIQTVTMQARAGLIPEAVQKLMGSNAATNTSYQSQVDETRGPDRPVPSQMPTQLPTAGSVLAAWRARAGVRETPNAWGFDVQLSNAGTQDGKPLPRVAVSSWEAGIQAEKTNGNDHTQRTSLLVYTEDGRVITFEDRARMDGPGPRGGGIAAGPAILSRQAASIAWTAPPPPVVAGAGVVALAVGFAAAWLGKGAKGIGALLLFSRVTDTEVAHPARQALLHCIQAAPGIHFKELQRRSGQGRSSTLHHVRKLIEAGHVREVRTPGYTCYVPAKMGGRDFTAAVPALQASGARRLFAAAVANPGLAQGELARLAGIQPSTASYHMQRLANAGLVSTAGGVRLTALGESAHKAGAAA